MNKREKEVISFALMIMDVMRDCDDLWNQVIEIIDAVGEDAPPGHFLLYDGETEEYETVEMPNEIEFMQVAKYMVNHPTCRRGYVDHRIAYSSISEMIAAFGDYSQT